MAVRQRETKREKKMILLAEDAKPVRDMVKEALEDAGYHVVEADDGRQAFERFEENADAFDLIIADSLMPRMDGTELGRHCRNRRQGVRILIITGGLENGPSLESFFREGNTEILPKPFSKKELLDRVVALLSGDK